MTNPPERLRDIIYTHGSGGRIRIQVVLLHYTAPDGTRLRDHIPVLWEKYESDIVREIQRIIARGRGKITVTLTSRGSLRLDEAIRLIAYLSLGYSTIPYQFLDLSTNE